MNNISLCTYTCQIFLIHSSASGHLGYFYFVDIEGSTAVNTGVWVFLQHSHGMNFLDITNEKISGSHGSYSLNFGIVTMLHNGCTNLYSYPLVVSASSLCLYQPLVVFVSFEINSWHWGERMSPSDFLRISRAENHLIQQLTISVSYC